MIDITSKYFFTKLITIILLLGVNLGYVKAQSTNCSTASQISLTTGSICVNGTSANSVTDNILYGTCNAAPVNIVWYTYIANGSNNTFTITPGTLTNAQIVIYTGGCPNTGALQTCTTTTGSNILTSTWGIVAGTQVWVGIASNGGNSGTFQLCVKSTPPAAGAGNTCGQAIPICSMTSFTKTSIPSNSSGTQPACFGSAPQQDVWLKFTISQSGSLGWKAIPNNASTGATEFDWALWDITAGCPGTLTCCNYNYAGGSSSGFGMQNITGTVACNNSAFSLNPAKEFSPRANVICGRTYAIQISNYGNDNVGFSFSFANSTCVVGTTASFVATPTLVCGASLTATITNSSVGTCQQVWDYGDGSATYTGGSPPVHTYTTPGTYAIKAQTTGACTSIATQFVKLLAPLAGTITSVNNLCDGACTGSASVSQITGGDGIYTYAWSPGGSSGNSINSLCAGNYTVSLANATCSTTITKTLTITAPPALTLTTNSFNPTCGASNGSITASSLGGTPGYSFSINNGSYSAVSTFSNLSSGSYTISSKDANACTINTILTLTSSIIPTITVNSFSICNGQSNTLTVNGGSSYTWSPTSGLSSTSGSVVVANPSNNITYSVIGTNGTCTNSATSSITVVANPTISVSSQTICAGTSATLNANGATTYTWSNATNLNTSFGTSVIASPLATEIYTIVGSNSGGCLDSTTVSLFVSSTPTILTSPNLTICPGSSSTISATGANTYTWSPGASLNTVNGSNVIASPTLSTTYTVTGTNILGCISSATASIVTGGTITVNVSPDFTVCPNTAHTFIASGASNYTWTPNLFLNTNTSGTVISTPTITTTYTVDGASGSCAGSNTVTITVSNTVVVAASANSPTICPFGNTALNASGAAGYTWTPSLTLNSPTGSTVTATPSSSQTYTVIGATGTCSNSAQVVVTVTTTPVITVANSPTICSGSSAPLNASGANTYTWSPAAGLTPITGANVTANPNSTTTYTIVGANVQGCSSFTTVTVSIVQVPSLSISSNPSSICSGKSSTLSVIGANTYTWSPAASLNSPNGASVVASPIINTTYNVFGSNTIGTVSCNSNAIITVNVIPNVTVTVSRNDTICLNESTIINASGGDTYNWNPANGLTSPTSSITLAQPNSTTIYTITASNGGLCPGTNTVQIIVLPLPSLYAGKDTTINFDESYVLHGTGNVPVGFLSPDGVPLICNYCPIVEVHPLQTTCYTLEAEDQFGCKNYDDVCITITKNWDIFIPNAFTPNGDLDNEYFMPKGWGLAQINMSIFDRWGVEIFQETDTKLGWDGKYKGAICQQGVYTYQIESVSLGGIKFKKTGHVSVFPKVN